MINNHNHREVVCIQGGQSGIQLGNALWELLTIEHHILSNGHTDSAFSIDQNEFQTFFECSSDDQIYPRLLTFDTEPTVVDEIRSGFYRKLFNPDMLISGYEDTANNFARGYLSESNRMMIPIVEKLRKLVENCDNFQGFLIYASTAGGTGGGLLSALIEYIVIEFAGRSCIQLSILPGNKLSSCIVQPYNCILSMERLIYNCDLNMIVDNEMLYSICCNLLEIQRPSFSNINRIVSPIISGLTAPIRFRGLIHNNLIDLATNLIPYPRLHFPFVSYAPLTSTDKYEHDLLNTENITRSIFNSENQFVNVDLKDGSFMSSVALYRGKCDISNILKTIQLIKADKNLQWVDWCPTGFKISHTLQTPFTIPGHGPFYHDKSAMMLSNHSSIISTFTELAKHFKLLFLKRAYLHWYICEGMETSELSQALYEVEMISDDYSRINEVFDMNEETSDIDYVLDNDFNRHKKSLKIRTDMDDTNLIEGEEGEEIEDQSYLITTTTSSETTDETSNDKTSPSRNTAYEIKKKGSSLSEKKTSNQIDDSQENSGYSQNSEAGPTESMTYGYRTEKPTLNFNNEPTSLLEETRKENKTVVTVDESVQKNINSSLIEMNPLYFGRSFNSSSTGSMQPSNLIFDICERSYVQQVIPLNSTMKKHLYFQKSRSTEKSNSSIIQKIYRKNRDIFHRLMHSRQYDFSKVQSS